MDLIKTHVKTIFFLFLSITVMSAKLPARKLPEVPPHIRYANQVTALFIKEAEQTFGMKCRGDGGSMPVDIQYITTEFTANQEANISEARELIINVIELFLKVVNSHENVRPFLREYPCTINSANITIWFKNEKSTPPLERNIFVVSLINDELHYDIMDGNNKLTTIKIEPYKEALEKIKKNTP